MVVRGRVVKEKGECVTAEGGSDLRGMPKSINQRSYGVFCHGCCRKMETGVLLRYWNGLGWTGLGLYIHTRVSSTRLQAVGV